MMRIAIYDLDKTLTRRATFTPFLMFAARRMAPWRLLLAPLWVMMMIGYRIGLYDRTALKRRGMKLMLGAAPLAMLERTGLEFARHRIENGGLLPGILHLLEEDRAAGAQIAIATAAFEFYAKAFAAHLGIETIIASKWDGDGIAGGNCYADEKLRRVVEWMAQLDRGEGPPHLRFVSDSFADQRLLDLADDPIFVTAGAGPARKAAARGWRVVDGLA